MGLLREALPASTLVIAIDPGKVSNRVWLSSGAAGMAVEPLSLPVLRPGLEALQRLVHDHLNGSDPVFAIEATGALHQVWVRELDQRFPGSVRLFAPSETAAARAQLGSRRFKTDDRDCAALTYLARQGQGRRVAGGIEDALAAAVRHRRGLVAKRKVAQQRLHDQLNALCRACSRPCPLAWQGTASGGCQRSRSRRTAPSSPPSLSRAVVPPAGPPSLAAGPCGSTTGS